MARSSFEFEWSRQVSQTRDAAEIAIGDSVIAADPGECSPAVGSAHSESFELS
ncbi:MAG: hypothetical protein ACK4S4_10625 [Pyrinomonadaceae bacterium]